MGPEFWKPDKASKLKKCSEFVTPACDPVATDGCCGVAACSYCLTWAVYGQADQIAVAEFIDDGWYGEIAGVLFRGFWERNYETDECEFVVTLDAVEIYRKSCYEGQSCRDSSDSVAATIYPDDGTLTWTKIEPRPLEYVTDPDTNCRTHFCGTCECSCDCLCVTITDGDDSTETVGEICDVSYPCDGPVWEGTVGDYELSLALGQDIYGDCIITATVAYTNGVEQHTVAATGCGAMTATITLVDGTTIAVACKVCVCAEAFACCPNIGTPAVLYLTLTTISMVCGCLNGQVIPMLPNGTLSGRLFYQAIWQWTCPDPFFPENVRWFKFDTSCQAGDAFPTIEVRSLVQLDTDPAPLDGNPNWGLTYVYYYDSGQCDPFYFHYEGTGGGDGVWVRCQDDFMDDPEIQMELTI